MSNNIIVMFCNLKCFSCVIYLQWKRPCLLAGWIIGYNFESPCTKDDSGQVWFILTHWFQGIRVVFGGPVGRQNFQTQSIMPLLIKVWRLTWPSHHHSYTWVIFFCNYCSFDFHKYLQSCTDINIPISSDLFFVCSYHNLCAS